MKPVAVLVVLLLTSCATRQPAVPYSVEAQELIRTCRYDEARHMLGGRLETAAGEQRAATLLQLGTLEENAGDMLQAIVHYRAALAQTGATTPLRASARLMLGMASARSRDYAGAIENLSAAIEYRDNVIHRKSSVGIGWAALAAFGVSLAESGRFAEAGAQFDRALRQLGRASGSKVRPALASWQQAAEGAARGGSRPAPDFFWAAAYGKDAALSEPASEYSHVPRVRVAPEYPRQALRRGIQGHVDMEVAIDETGKPTHVRIVDSQPPGVFERAAVSSIRQWKFQPRIVDCRAVPAIGAQRIEFRLRPDPDADFDRDDVFPGPESVLRMPLPRESN